LDFQQRSLVTLRAGALGISQIAFQQPVLVLQQQPLPHSIRGHQEDLGKGSEELTLD
jgi:hypothetical protein